MTLREEGSATHAIVNHTVVEVGRGVVAGGLTCEYILAHVVFAEKVYRTSST